MIVCFLLNYSSIQERMITRIRLFSLISFNKTAVEDMAKSLVIVTGATSNHFGELLAMIGSFQRYHNETTIFVFNVGLTKDEISKINMIKNVRLEHYNFSENPYFPGSPGLGGYTFKVHIINKISKNYDVVFWADASTRISKPLSKSLFKRLLEFPIIAASKHGASNRFMVAFARDSTVKYFNMSREDGRGVEGFSSGGLLFNFANVTARLLLKKWVDCALHKECIVGSPIHSTDGDCDWKTHTKISDLSFIGCHRYDQVTINLLTIKTFGKKLTEQVVTPEALKTFYFERRANKTLNNYIMWK